MKFKFPLDSLRRHRKNIEEIARRDYIEAKRVSDEILNTINKFYESSDRAREFASLELTKKLLDPAVLQVASEFIDGNKIRIEKKKNEFREALAETEHKQQLLVEASKETKVLDKLRENCFAEFKKKQKKLDKKSIDEIVVQRHRFRRSHGQKTS